MKKFVFWLVIQNLLFYGAFAQSCFSVNSPILACGATCTTLTVTPGVPGGLAATTSYSVSAVAYAPFSYIAGTSAAGVGQDDIWSSIVNLPFYFCFFGNSYNRITIGSNGQVSFNISRAGMTNDHTVTSNNGLPNAPSVQADVRNCILGPYHDLNPALGGTVRYQTYGTAPCRAFVVSWNNVPLNNCTTLRATQQIVLYEATNTIDINIASKPLCAAWNFGSAITGINNGSGTLFYTATGENGAQFSATNESWRFAPAGAASPWSYTWRGPSGAVISNVATANVCPTVTTVYTVTATNTSCANLSATVTATVTPAGASPIVGLNTTCPGAILPLSNAVAGGTWSSSNSNLATVNPTTGQVTGVAPGSPVIKYTFPGGCFTTMTLTVGGRPQLSGVTNICVASTTTLSVSQGGGTWLNLNPGVASLNTSTREVTGVSAGNALLIYANLCGIDTISITVNSVAQITGQTLVCVGSAIHLSDATSGGTWSSNNTARATVSAAGVVTGVSAGTVKIAYTAATGCSDTSSVLVNAPPTVSAPVHVCAGGVTTLSGSPAGGVWVSTNESIATVTSAGGSVKGVSAGTVSIIYIFSGCTATTTVTVDPLTYSSAGSVGLCAGSVVTLSNASSGGTWSSSNTNIATITAGGNVSGTTAGTAVMSYATPSCTVSTTTVTVKPVPMINGASSMCMSTSVTLSTSPGGGMWSYSNTGVATVSGSNIVTPISAGVVTLTYTLSGGCYYTKTLTVLSSVPSISGIKQLCTTQTVQLSNTAAGGTWVSTPGTVATIDAGGVVTGIGAGIARITYSLATGCITSTSVTVYALPNAGSISGTAVLCVGNNVVLSSTAGGGVWSTGDTTVSVSGGTVTGLYPDTATIWYVVSNPACADTAADTIVVLSVPDAGIISGPTAFCQGTTITLSDAAVGGTWLSHNITVATVSGGGVVTGMTLGVDTISYTVSNAACAATTMHTVTVVSVPNAGVISGQQLVCAGAVYSLADTAAGGIWSSSSPAVATIDSNTGQVRALSGGTTVIRYTNSGVGVCTSVATFTVTVLAKAVFDINAVVTPIACHGDSSGSIAVTVTGGVPPFSYHWSTTDTVNAIYDLLPGTYVLNVREPSTQCIADTGFVITQPDSLSVTDSALSDFCQNGTGAIYVSVNGGVSPYSYSWSNGAGTTSIENLSAGVYSVMVTDMNNCKAVTTTVVTDSVCLAVIPHDVVTPNGDGINDTWVVEGLEAYVSSTVQVFDKFGNKVFERKNYKNDWDCRWANGFLPDGTYFYLIKLNERNAKGGADTFTGSILVKR